MSGGPRWDRRRVLRAGAAAAGGAGLGWSASAAVAHAAGPATSSADDAVTVITPSAGSETVPVAGRHQVGVDTVAQAHLSLIGWNLRDGATADDLTRMMRLLSDDAARLAVGEGALADTEPELAAHPSRLTVTFGWGPRVLTHLVAADRRPSLEPLPDFSRDRLDPAWGQTDVVAQVCSDDPVTLAHARRMLVKDAHDLAEVAWVQHGFRPARGSAPEGTTMRNLMGQVDGTVNLSPAASADAPLLWAEGPEAFAGGTFLVVRRIRMHLDRWDRVDRVGREATMGRRLDTGAPLTGTDEYDEPDFSATDRFGFPVIDPASHVARARSADPTERFLRRSYNYACEASGSAEEDAGLVFLAFAADPARQFVPVQRRLDELDRLNEWVTTIGSAVYAVLPAAPEGGFVGQQMLEVTP